MRSRTSSCAFFARGPTPSNRSKSDRRSRWSLRNRAIASLGMGSSFVGVPCTYPMPCRKERTGVSQPRNGGLRYAGSDGRRVRGQRSELDDGADDLAALHLLDGLVDAVEADLLGD